MFEIVFSFNFKQLSLHNIRLFYNI